MSASFPTNARSHFTSHAQFTSSGVCRPSKSCPDRRNPFSRRRVSRAPSPIGRAPNFAPSARSASQTSYAREAGRKNPNTPPPKPARPGPELRALREERLPDLVRSRGRREELEPRLPRISRPRDKNRGSSSGRRAGEVRVRHDGRSPSARGPPPLRFRWNLPVGTRPFSRKNELERARGEGTHGLRVDLREPGEEPGSARTLQRKTRERLRHVLHPNLGGKASAKPRRDALARSRIAHDEEPTGRETRHDRVVEDRRVLAEEVGVFGGRRNPRDLIRAQPIEARMGARTLHQQLPHVAHVEEARRGADRAMLFDDSCVLERAIPPPALRHSE